MESFGASSGFRFNPNSNTIDDADRDSEFSGILEIYVHHARNIHNICIYENQDVYAKFSLTYNPDDTRSTRIVNGGGKNPDFNENLMIKVTQIDAVLKCEIWMLSRARNYLEDQLLGFALVPISQVIGKGKMTRDYSLSSTDLFHSPAGTVKLSLSLNSSMSVINSQTTTTSTTTKNSSISSEVVLLDRKVTEPEVVLDPVEYSRMEFPDMNVVRENQQMVSEYFNGLNSRQGIASFLQLGASHQHVDQDYEMTANSSEEIHGTSPNGSLQNSGFFSSTTTSLSDDRNSADSNEKKSRLGVCGVPSVTSETNQSPGGCPDTPTSKKGSDVDDSNCSSKEVFSGPLVNINMEAEQSAMQQQIVDMYMRSMQQFTESLAKMKLPMDLDLDHKPEHEDRGDLIRNNSKKIEHEKKKDDRSRVFYGSRAFF